MSFAPYRLIARRLVPRPELAALSVLDAALKQAICALLAQYPDLGAASGGPAAESTASTIIAWAWDLRRLLRRYRADLSRERSRDIPY